MTPVYWRVPVEIPLPANFAGFDPRESLPLPDFHSYERHLPHWRLPGICYFSTFRLNDSIPAEILQQMQIEAREWRQRLAQAAALNGGRLPAEEQTAWEQFQRVHLLKLESTLDEGHGECLLRDATLRAIVVAALHHFENERCEMLAFVIMPNHVHTLCRPLDGHVMENLAGSWKRHTAEKINRATDRSGTLWQQETFDRIIRDAGHYSRVVRYIAKNPIKARLRDDEASVWFCPTIRDANRWSDALQP